MNKQIKAALDFSGTSVALALEVSSEVVLTVEKPMARRESALLASWVVEQLATCGVLIRDVEYWTCGSGPGSFTGMRLAAALIEGWTFGKETIKRRAVPGALAMTELVNLSENERCGVLFDGRNREMLLFEVQKSDGKIVHTGKTAILNQAQATVEFADLTGMKLCALGGDMSALQELLASEVVEQIIQVDSLPIASMLKSEYGVYDGDLTQLVYIRPSVTPKEA